ncbi:alpha/beta fold hydrolase [Verticiella sediminum]|uniref:Alpha/beta fold hydrolase n=1 Tax=Verticiella sediminum TaxID=1247510 RepID=A0A556B056_9BURK|nr:alpha/beta fold hydrolase [Verticiella sediminum]TSH98567.1 alpha/beta fold hydrolase [Verticiella sediminum]
MPELMLIPGLNNTGDVFAGVVQALPVGVTAHCPSCPPLERVEAIADALLETAPERFFLAGFSFGGYVALAMLARVPQRVAGIALICSDSGADTPAQRERRRAARQRAADGEYEAMIEAQAGNAFHPASLARPDLLAARRRMVSDYGAERFIAHTEAVMQRPDRTGLLDGLRPTLFVAASDDAVFPPAGVQARAAAVPGAQYVCLPDAGHLLPMEQPRALADVLAAWVSARRG